jgi:hypothetical protein
MKYVVLFSSILQNRRGQTSRAAIVTADNDEIAKQIVIRNNKYNIDFLIDVYELRGEITYDECVDFHKSDDLAPSIAICVDANEYFAIRFHSINKNYGRACVAQYFPKHNVEYVGWYERIHEYNQNDEYNEYVVYAKHLLGL